MKLEEDHKLEVKEGLRHYAVDTPLKFPFDLPCPPVEESTFTFIDLFAGIGGFRLPLQELGGRCLFSSEWDKQAQATYFANFGDTPYGDIRLESVKSMIPCPFALLRAGFPCQAFSIAGHRKRFDEARGTPFFEVAKIFNEHQPKAFSLENVKGAGEPRQRPDVHDNP